MTHLIVDVAPDDARQKRIETMRAELALLAGISMHQLSDGAFLLTRWNLTRRCSSLEEVQAFLREIGVRS